MQVLVVNKGDREEISDVLIILTDGNPFDENQFYNTLPAAERIHARNITVTYLITYHLYSTTDRPFYTSIGYNIWTKHVFRCSQSGYQIKLTKRFWLNCPLRRIREMRIISSVPASPPSPRCTSRCLVKDVYT